MKRYSGAERAKHRYYIRIYTAIWSEGFDKIATAFQAEYQSSDEAFKAYATATRDAAKQCISDVIEQLVKERVIRPALSDALR